MKAIKIFSILSILFLVSCNPINRDLLTNGWKGQSILFNGAPSELDPEPVRLDLRADGTFSYTDVVGNDQNGTFRTNKMGVLYLSPSDGFEKAWQVVYLSQDSLILKIENLTKEYEMVLVAKK
ncbi:MAG: hypothetical protein AAF502_00075 [Bacteroidota bacterium]